MTFQDYQIKLTRKRDALKKFSSMSNEEKQEWIKTLKLRFNLYADKVFEKTEDLSELKELSLMLEKDVALFGKIDDVLICTEIPNGYDEMNILIKSEDTGWTSYKKKRNGFEVFSFNFSHWNIYEMDSYWSRIADNYILHRSARKIQRIFRMFLEKPIHPDGRIGYYCRQSLERTLEM